jgi:copper homeostasis protein
MKRVVELAYPMGVTCNRVIDAASDVFEALEDLISAGCERVLTAGQASSAPEGAAVLAQLVTQAADRIIVMPGAGVRASNIAALRAATGATEFHSSARLLAPNLVTSTNDKILDAGTYWVADEAELRAMVQALR